MNVQIDYNNHEYSDPEHYWNFKGKLDFVDKWLLMASPLPLIVITTAYIIFVLKLGPDFMKKRKAYTLRNTLLVYNVGQVVFSAYIFYLCMKMLVPLGLIHKTCNMETEESRYQITSANYFYFASKVTELLDTVFFVLRKKQNQVSFLHVYHHFFMAWSPWMLLKYEPGYSLLFTGTLNSFVHIIMYSYYGLSAFPSMTKYLWWKKYITKMQLTQFFLVFIHFLVNSVKSECKVSKILSGAIIFNLFLFTYLFLKFYIESYLKTNVKNETKTKNETIRNGSDKYNGKSLEGRTKNTDNKMKEETFNNNSNYRKENEANTRYIKKQRPLGESFQSR